VLTGSGFAFLKAENIMANELGGYINAEGLTLGRYDSDPSTSQNDAQGKLIGIRSKD